MSSTEEEHLTDAHHAEILSNTNGSKLDYGLERHYPEYITFVPSALKYISKNGAELPNHDRYTKIGSRSRMRFKMVKSNQLLVRTILHSYGFEQCSERNPNVNLIWSASHLSPYTLRSLAPWQRVNHFPRSSELTRKDKLYENIARARNIFGDAFNFIPDFFVSPRELASFTESFNASEVNKPFIAKPVASSRGHGIFIIRKPQEIPLVSNLLVSEYITDPYLIDGHKFDLRIYVVVTSFYPLTVYIYNDGLARFASEKYSGEEKTFDEHFCHLTNYSLNKLNKHFMRNKCAADEGSGHKWTLGAALRRMKADGVDTQLLMIRIESVILKTLLSVQGPITARCRSLLLHSKCCFELFGFDILIDSQLKPWLLEVNLSPSLICDSPLDLQLKSALVCDTLTLAAIPLVHGRSENTYFNNSSVPCKRVSSAREITLRRALKIKKGAMLSKRTFSYNALKPSQSYERKAKFLLDRFKIETMRRGGFVCIFPRRNSWRLYRCIMEDIGLEKWDFRLHYDLYGEEAVEGVDDNLAKLAHQQLNDCKSYPEFSTLDDGVKALLVDAFQEVLAYEKRITVDGVTYAARLPKVRAEARKRTSSLIEEEQLLDYSGQQSSIDDISSSHIDLETKSVQNCVTGMDKVDKLTSQSESNIGGEEVLVNLTRICKNIKPPERNYDRGDFFAEEESAEYESEEDEDPDEGSTAGLKKFVVDRPETNEMLNTTTDSATIKKPLNVVTSLNVDQSSVNMQKSLNDSLPPKVNESQPKKDEKRTEILENEVTSGGTVLVSVKPFCINKREQFVKKCNEGAVLQNVEFCQKYSLDCEVTRVVIPILTYCRRYYKHFAKFCDKVEKVTTTAVSNFCIAFAEYCLPNDDTVEPDVKDMHDSVKSNLQSRSGSAHESNRGASKPELKLCKDVVEEARKVCNPFPRPEDRFNYFRCSQFFKSCGRFVDWI